jgi:Fic family protein
MKKRIFDRAVPYNLLPLLPPSEDLENNPEILKKLVGASRALAMVDGHINRLPNPLMLVNTIALREAKASTEIENIFTTEDELYKAISDSRKAEKVNVATREVLKYREALWAGYEYLQKTQAFDTRLMVNIFNQIKESKSNFRPPQSKVTIKRGQSELRSGEIIYTPPRGEGIIEKMVENLLDYMNDDQKYTADPLLKMCVAHYQFEAIHPFRDGNGRSGRILNLLYLVQKGLISKPVLYMSSFIISNKEDYYFKLGEVTQRQAWHDWILYMLEAVEETSRLTNLLIDEILEQMERTLDFARKKIKWYNKEVNEAIYSQPYIKAATIGAVMGKTSRTTQIKYMNDLVLHQILRPVKEGTEVFYINDDLIHILES